MNTLRGPRSLRRRACARAGLGALLVLFAAVPAPAHADNGRSDNVTPVFECAQVNADGSYTAFFGYLSPNPETRNVDVGSDNWFAPTPADRGQPSDFAPGRHVSTVSVKVPANGSVTWHLDGNAATSSVGRPCSGNPVVSEFGTASAAVLAVGLPVLVWYRRGRRAAPRPSLPW